MRSLPHSGSEWVLQAVNDNLLPAESWIDPLACMLTACKLEGVFNAIANRKRLVPGVQQIVHSFGCLEPVR